MGMPGNFGDGNNAFGGMTPGQAFGGGLTQTDPATGRPYGEVTPTNPNPPPFLGFPGPGNMPGQPGAEYRIPGAADAQMALLGGMTGGQPQMAMPGYTEEMAQRGQTSMLDNPYGGMTPGDAFGGGLALPQPNPTNPNPPPFLGFPGPGNMPGGQPQLGMPAYTDEMSQRGQTSMPGTPAPTPYPNLMQNPAFNPAAAPPPIPTPPTLAQQIASPAPGAQQLIDQLSQPAPQQALAQPPQTVAPLPTPAPVTQQPFSYAAPKIDFPTPPRVDMEFLRAPGETPPAPPPVSAPFTPPPPEPGNRFSYAAPEITIPTPPRVNMDFLRAPTAAPAPAARPVAQPAPMPTRATQGYESRLPARGAYIAPKTPVKAPAPKPAPKPTVRSRTGQPARSVAQAVTSARAKPAVKTSVKPNPFKNQTRTK